MSNILFALYHDFTSNSAIHVHNFASNLAAFGHSVAVAVPDNKETAGNLGEPAYIPASFAECDGTWEAIFPDGRGPDIVHAWTPRENVRLFCEKLMGFASFTLIIHLEDNEELILQANLGLPFEELARTPSLRIPPNLSHPKNYRLFLASASGITLIMDRLEKFVPPEVPSLTLWPGADRQLFFPRGKDETFLARLGVPPADIILCYPGNVHSANAREVRSLYLAAAILRREGIPTTLVRAGLDYCSFLGPDEKWAREVSVDLGYVKHVEIPKVLGLADFLIQPGTDDEFNEYRLPAKLPEFFAMGRPVVLPHTNAGRFVRHGKDAWVLPKVDALGIVDAITRFRADQSLVSQLSAGALAFCEEHFDWSKNASMLNRFYQQISSAEQKQPHVAIPTVL
jgi:glycosyltransferase involved in cell wall biosynthesis